MPPTPANGPFVEDEINLHDYWRVLVRRRWLIVGVTACIAIATAIISLLQPHIYQSKATLMPLGTTMGALPGALGELGGLLGFESLRGQTSPTERILAILDSRTLTEDVIQRLDLLPRLFAAEWDTEQQRWQTDEPPTVHDAVRMLDKLVAIDTAKKTGVITIAVEHTAPELAAAIANQYMATLQGMLNENAFSLATKNRLFIEAQLEKTQQRLAAAEEVLRGFEQQHGIVALDAQAKAAVDALATLEGQIMAKEVQLGVLQRSVTGASHEVTLLQEEIRGLREQLARLQYGPKALHAAAEDTARNDQALLSLEQAPEIKLQYVRLQRDVLIHDKLFLLLRQQLEHMKIEEVRDATAFQVLDKAIPPDRRIKPQRRLMVMLGTFVGAFLSIFLAFVVEYRHPQIHTREQIERQGETVLLATIPPVVPPRRLLRRRGASSAAADLVLQQPPGAPSVESYRYLYTRLQHLNGAHSPQTVVFTSPEPAPEALTVPANLAIVAANTGAKTLLVDGNLRQPALHGLLQCPLMPGLADVLPDPSGWHKGIHPTAIDNLHLLPAGTVSEATFSLLESPAFDTLLAHLKKAYTRILFVAPPVLGLSDAAVLGSKAEATCLVLTAGVSRFEAFTEAKAALQAVQANVVGAILTGFKS